MAITPDALLQTAREMASGAREVDWRNAASRAYYAAHHRCIPFAYERASVSPGHAQMIADLKRRSDADGSMQVGYLLEHCKVLRERADYRLEATFRSVDANLALTRTSRIFDITDPM